MRPLDELLDLLARADAEPYIGEPVSQLAHALQCADLAARASASDALVAAALLHDVGHLAAPSDAPRMYAGSELGVAEHERLGAERLRAAGFGEAVIAPVARHVLAKRWLVLRRPAYRARLSAASTGTLALQGGPLSDDEAAAFERDAFFDDALCLRAWDEQAKDSAWRGPPLGAYRALLARLLSA